MILTGAQFVFSTTQLLIAGIVTGIIVTAPVGPVNVLCIQRTLARGFWAGVAVGIGAVLADGLLASFAGFGLSAISSVFQTHAAAIRLVGGLILIAYGIKLLLAKPVASMQPAVDSMRLSAHTSAIPKTFLLTITNPGAVLGMFAIFGSVSSLIGGLQDIDDAALMVLGVIAGSLAWWCLLARFVATIRHRISEAGLGRINKIAGCVLIVFGLVLLGDLAGGWY